MSLIQYANLLPEVLPHLTGDPSEPLAINAIRNAVIEFCARSWVWRHFPDAQDVEAGEPSYRLEPPAGADVAMVLSCRYDGEPITQASSDSLDEKLPGWQTDSGCVKYFTQPDTESIVLAPIPDANIDAGLAMVLAVQPRRAATTFPRWIHAQYMEQIAAGAIAKLMNMPGKPWASPQAVHYQAKFDNGIASAKESALRGLGRGVVRTTPQH